MRRRDFLAALGLLPALPLLPAPRRTLTVSDPFGLAFVSARQLGKTDAVSLDGAEAMRKALDELRMDFEPLSAALRKPSALRNPISPHAPDRFFGAIEPQESP